MMNSSRIYIRGLPPNLTDKDFQEHFSKFSPITDSKLISRRRIGYIGYKTNEDAARAVKYFNKTFIRLSKIAVELARSVGRPNATDDGALRNSWLVTSWIDRGPIPSGVMDKHRKV